MNEKLFKCIAAAFSTTYGINAGLSLYRLGEVIRHGQFIYTLFRFEGLDILILVNSLIGAVCLFIGYAISMYSPIYIELKLLTGGVATKSSICSPKFVSDVTGALIYSTFKSFNTSELLYSVTHQPFLTAFVALTCLVIDLICTKSWLSYDANRAAYEESKAENTAQVDADIRDIMDFSNGEKDLKDADVEKKEDVECGEQIVIQLELESGEEKGCSDVEGK
tara:strand:+ start:126 stop:791 length:666 start_codon:yes stop_codon:yes gene_type:complete